MNKILYTLVVIATLTSCAESYSIQGTSSVSSLDGSKLYLKTVKDQELKNLDSCDVVHGKFRFAGLLDTVKLANLYMDDESLMMPVVVEKGEIEIRIDNTGRNVSGTPLNDKLYQFINRHDQIGNEMNELSHKQSQMLLDGIDEDIINKKLSVEAARLAQQEDSLVTNFIVENFDNVLGPGVFMMMTSSIIRQLTRYRLARMVWLMTCPSRLLLLKHQQRSLNCQTPRSCLHSTSLRNEDAD